MSSRPRTVTGHSRVRLFHRGSAIDVAAGIHLIGRARECQVVLEDRMVSREHARLVVDARGATLEDLASANGVFVNGRRIERQRLVHGDVIQIGDEQLAISVRPLSPAPPGRGELASETRRVETIPEPPPSAAFAPTKKAHALDLLGNVADRALASGQALQAEAAVQARLLEVLHAVSNGNGEHPEIISRALGLALALARALRKRRWLNYAIDLLAATGEPCSDSSGAALRSAGEAVGGADPERLARYADALRALPSSLEKLRTLALIEQLRPR
jgi:pSer/pThr/pTyr-binding forkhead associated (FHA) protein